MRTCSKFPYCFCDECLTLTPEELEIVKESLEAIRLREDPSTEGQ